MSTGWVGSTRHDTLPPNWPSIQRAVLERDDYRCQIQDPARCIYRATEVDHVGDRNDHRMAVLRAACHPCHQHRSSSQGGQAWAAKHKRPSEKHPGLR